MYKIKTTNCFEKDTERCIKRNYDLSPLEMVVSFLESNGKLPPHFKFHILSDNYSDCRECHLKPDWLLIWRQNDELLEIELLRTGTHSDLF
jgi:mRNA interferase YafQ